jgi:DNA-binding transcriptional ArsR family regulator
MRNRGRRPASVGRDEGSEGRPSSLDKALEICETLASAARGLTISDLARALDLPPPTVHRLLAGLKRRGYVRQDEETTRYALTLKMLDLSFRLLGGSELRLHAYPVVREFVLRTGSRAFIAVPQTGEVTYLWAAGPDAVSMHTVYGRAMPGHCAMYFDEGSSTRRLSCLRLESALDLSAPDRRIVRLGMGGEATGQRLNCTCAPVFDYSGREAARVGLFGHGSHEGTLVAEDGRHAWDLARLISLRLGHLPGVSHGGAWKVAGEEVAS